MALSETEVDLINKNIAVLNAQKELNVKQLEFNNARIDQQIENLQRQLPQA